MVKYKLVRSLRKVIDAWADDAAQSQDWIESYFPENGVDLMVQSAINTLEAIESAGLFAEEQSTDEATN